MIEDKAYLADVAQVGIEACPKTADSVHFQGRFYIECIGPDGKVKWAEHRDNLVTTAGKNDALTQWLKGSAYTAANFFGLIDNASFSALSASDVLTSHSGWVESTAYSTGTRIAPTWGTASGGSIDNSVSPATFTINATAVLNGVFMATGSTKGSTGTTGTLISEVSFGATRSVASGDKVTVTYTMTG